MRVKKVQYVSEYKLKILFSDGKTKIVDIEPIINKSRKIFKPLKDIDYFKQVALDDPEYPLSICWPNGADICPDLLYEMGIEAAAVRKRTPSRKKQQIYTSTLHESKPNIAAKSKS